MSTGRSCTMDLRPSIAGFLHGPKHAELWEFLAASSLDIRGLVSLELVDLIKPGSTEPDHLSRSPFCLVRSWVPSSVSLTELTSPVVAEAPTSSGNSSPHQPSRTTSRASDGVFFSSPDNVALSIREISVLSRLSSESFTQDFLSFPSVWSGGHFALQHDVEVVFVKLPLPRDFSCTIDLRPSLAGFLHGPKLWELLAASSLDICGLVSLVDFNKFSRPASARQTTLSCRYAFCLVRLRVSSNLSLPGPNHAEIRELLATATVNIRALVSLELVDFIKFGSTELDHLSSPDNVALSIRWSPFCLVRVISPAVQWPVGLLWRYGSFVRAPTSSGTSSPNIRGPVSRLYQAPIDPAGPPLVLLTAFCVHDDQSAGFGSPDDVALLIWERSGLCLVGGLSLTGYAYFDVVGCVHSSCGLTPPSGTRHRPIDLVPRFVCTTSRISRPALVRRTSVLVINSYFLRDLKPEHSWTRFSTLSSSDRPSWTTYPAPDGVLCTTISRPALARQTTLHCRHGRSAFCLLAPSPPLKADYQGSAPDLDWSLFPEFDCGIHCLVKRAAAIRLGGHLNSHVEPRELLATSNIRGSVSLKLVDYRIVPPLVLLTAFYVHDDGFGSPDDLSIVVSILSRASAGVQWPFVHRVDLLCRYGRCSFCFVRRTPTSLQKAPLLICITYQLLPPPGPQA
ncbi:hypothetical protein B0H11DRAFT_1922344 [Mycena galericulata]|nr:hypothetical protein B0H11DRAFT_1922344 [Mycena galericulata]